MVGWLPRCKLRSHYAVGKPKLPGTWVPSMLPTSGGPPHQSLPLSLSSHLGPESLQENESDPLGIGGLVKFVEIRDLDDAPTIFLAAPSASPHDSITRMAKLDNIAEPHEVYPTILVLDFG